MSQAQKQIPNNERKDIQGYKQSDSPKVALYDAVVSECMSYSDGFNKKRKKTKRE